MAFIKTENNNGKVDKNINIKGRLPGKPKTRREIRDSELLSILRKIKPHLSESIMTAATIMKNDKATEAGRLKAAVILLEAYRELVDDVYNGVDIEEEGTEVQPNTPVFSLKVINE